MRCIFLLLIFTPLIFAAGLQTSDRGFDQYEYADISVKQYKKAYNSAYKQYKHKISQNFQVVEVGSQTKWVSYIDSFKTKSVVDFS